jgi:ribose 5-phosphate isomerase B
MIAIANDHTALELKKEIIALLNEMGLEFKDFGTNVSESCHYPIFGARAAHAVASGECERGILICGTGLGIGITANKVNGIRCCICSEPYTAQMSRLHNDANMISIGARVVGPDLARMIVKTFLVTEFEGGRHQTRVNMINAIGRDEALE